MQASLPNRSLFTPRAPSTPLGEGAGGLRGSAPGAPPTGAPLEPLITAPGIGLPWVCLAPNPLPAVPTWGVEPDGWVEARH